MIASALATPGADRVLRIKVAAAARWGGVMSRIDTPLRYPGV